MSNVLTQTPTESNKATTQIHQLAWIIIVVSFTLFCSLSIALTGGVYYYLVRSTVPMTVNLQVGRGTAGVVTVNEQFFPRISPTPTSLSTRPANLSTDTLSQATVTFSVQPDNEGNPSVIGTLTLQNDTSLTLQSAGRPRFPWSVGAYTIDLTQFAGQAEIFISSIPDDRPLQFRLGTELGNATVLINDVGRYSIIANETVIRITTYEGRALLISPDNQNNRFAVAGERVTLLTGSNLPIVTPAPVDLLQNARFAFDVVTNPETGALQIPQQWGCFNDFEESPSGAWYADTWEGRPAIRMIREVGSRTSQTGCQHWLDTPVDNYSYLELQATLSLNFQSLVNCGVVGSECPMMIFINYTDINGQDREWYQSFFYNYDPNNPAPLICQECGQAYEHLPISDKVWYTYESGNLISRLPEDQRPARILEVRFYASGHQYDVFLSEISLFAGTEQVAEVPMQFDG
ncbi:MAG: hypothetical protein AAF846_21530 [Chloroflexota bacterium]